MVSRTTKMPYVWVDDPDSKKIKIGHLSWKIFEDEYSDAFWTGVREIGFEEIKKVIDESTMVILSWTENTPESFSKHEILKGEFDVDLRSKRDWRVASEFQAALNKNEKVFLGVENVKYTHYDYFGKVCIKFQYKIGKNE